MTRQVSFPEYEEIYEYHGSTMIERIRLLSDEIIKRDWIMFDSVEEASEFFNDR